ncbi:MAG: hypothetical protein PHV07_08290 [Oscillospiraceae bacterium]|nr:hypothetical protein [Oscillospiraceae bacterium]
MLFHKIFIGSFHNYNPFTKTITRLQTTVTIARQKENANISIKYCLTFNHYQHYATLKQDGSINGVALGLIPEIEEVEYSDELVEGMQDDVTVEQIADSSNESEVVEFED